MEKKCGEITDFYKEFEQFMEFLSKFMPFFVQICVEKNWAQKCVCGEKNDKYQVWGQIVWNEMVNQNKYAKTFFFKEIKMFFIFP